MSIVTGVTSTALWHDVICEAEKSCSVMLEEDLESYLVFLLMRYTSKPELVKQVIAIEFLENLTARAAQKTAGLQEVGDKCLLFAGLFPTLAEKRLVRLSYFVNLGQAAYVGISRKRNDLYDHLSHQFVLLMDILQSIRHYSQNCPDLLPLQAYEQWNDTGSQRALSILKRYTHSTPVLMDIKQPSLFNLNSR